MGLFSRNWNRPGPGVPKDLPRKKGAARFFELLGREFWELAKLNLILAFCVAPTVVVFFLGMFGAYSGITFLLSLVLAFPVGGAVVACVYYITKLMRDDPSFVWFEFKRKFLENYLQAAPIGVLCTAFIYAQIMLWGSILLGEGGEGILWFFIALLSLLIFGMITPYIFLHFACVDLQTYKTVKNSVLMSFAYLPRSFMGAIQGASLWIIFALFFPVSVIAFPLFIFGGVTVSMLLCLMWVWKPFDTHFKIEETLVKRMEEEENEENQEGDVAKRK